MRNTFKLAATIPFAAAALAACGTSTAGTPEFLTVPDNIASLPDDQGGNLRDTFVAAVQDPDLMWQFYGPNCQAFLEHKGVTRDTFAAEINSDTRTAMKLIRVDAEQGVVEIVEGGKFHQFGDLVKGDDGWRKRCPDIYREAANLTPPTPSPEPEPEPESEPAATVEPAAAPATTQPPEPATATHVQTSPDTSTTYTPPPVGFTGAPDGPPHPLYNKTIDFCLGEGTQPGTTMFTDGTTGWTTHCANTR